MTFSLLPPPGRPAPPKQRPASRRSPLAALLLCLLLGLAAGIPAGLTACQAPLAESTDASLLPAAAELRQSYETYQAGGPSQASFADLARTVFIREVSSDTLTLHYHLAVPSDFGIDGYAVTLGIFPPMPTGRSFSMHRPVLNSCKKSPAKMWTAASA